jgi:aspartyl-tRNA(Asn)/glutamyl-tRNA(Gln) amidotransferase subunit C
VSITTEDVAHIAKLARLALDRTELERMATQLNGILAHMEELRGVDIAGVEPFALAAENAAPPRVDVPGADSLRIPPAALAIAWRDGFFTLPRLDAQRAGPMLEAE